MSDGKEVKRVWISFGEHGDVTYEQDWQVDEPALSKKFGDDKFYTYYAFREMQNGESFVSASDHDRIVAELRAEVEVLKEEIIGYKDRLFLTRKFDSRDTTIARQAREAEVSKAVIEVAKRVLHNAGLRPPDGGTPTVETICEDLNDAIKEIAAIERAEGEKEHE